MSFQFIVLPQPVQIKTNNTPTYPQNNIQQYPPPPQIHNANIYYPSPVQNANQYIPLHNQQVNYSYPTQPQINNSYPPPPQNNNMNPSYHSNNQQYYPAQVNYNYPSVPAPPPACENSSGIASHTLHTDSILQQDQYLVSQNQRYYARLQCDGNFVVYNSSNFISQNAIWASNTYQQGFGPYTLKMLADGNLVLYDSRQTSTWSSNTYKNGLGPYRLVMQDDGNLVLYDCYNIPTWSTNTKR
ncbi:hypothetical protein ABPG72_005351 [Tetrahymena utriculariae]